MKNKIKIAIFGGLSVVVLTGCAYAETRDFEGAPLRGARPRGCAVRHG